MVRRSFAAFYEAGLVEGARLMRARAIYSLEIRQGLYGGEPMTRNESAIAREMLDAVAALDHEAIGKAPRDD